MDTELKAKWVEALRSGDYDQTRQCLRDRSIEGRPGYCCLGVLLDLQGAVWPHDSSPRIDGIFAAHEEGGWAAPRFAGGLTYEQQQDLATLNDGGKFFSEIADYIEANL